VILEINEMLDLPDFARVFVDEVLRRIPATAEPAVARARR
jgi:hypothetical protein